MGFFKNGDNYFFQKQRKIWMSENFIQSYVEMLVIRHVLRDPSIDLYTNSRYTTNALQ